MSEWKNQDEPKVSIKKSVILQKLYNGDFGIKRIGTFFLKNSEQFNYETFKNFFYSVVAAV